MSAICINVNKQSGDFFPTANRSGQLEHNDLFRKIYSSWMHDLRTHGNDLEHSFCLDDGWTDFRPSKLIDIPRQRWKFCKIVEIRKMLSWQTVGLLERQTQGFSAFSEFFDLILCIRYSSYFSAVCIEKSYRWKSLLELNSVSKPKTWEILLETMSWKQSRMYAVANL